MNKHYDDLKNTLNSDKRSNSESYISDMNKIVMPDELKAKILSAAADKINSTEDGQNPEKIIKIKTSNGPKNRKTAFRIVSGFAACVVLCTAYIGIKNSGGDNIISDITDDSIVYTPKTERNDNSADNADNNRKTVTDTSDTNQRTVSERRPSNINTNPVSGGSKFGGGNMPESGEASNGGESDSSRPTDNRIANPNTTADSDGATSGGNINDSEPPKNDSIGDIPVMALPPTNSADNDSDVEQGMCGGNPFDEKNNLDEIQKEVGYVFKVPHYMPKGYKTDSMTVMFGAMIQISYTNKANGDEIIYRTEKTTGDISGDYSEYKNVETKNINDSDVEIKSNSESCHTATWNDDGAYSVYSRNGIIGDDMEKIVESVDYPKAETEDEESKQNTVDENGGSRDAADDKVKY